VRRAGDSLRITVQLIDASADAQLWGAKYGGTLDDVFELQERVSREIVTALGITLSSDEDRRLAHRSIRNVRAFELYLQARQELRRYDETAVDRADALTRRAIEIEGDTPPLQALLAWCRIARVRSGAAADQTPLDAAATVAASLVVTAPDAPYGHALLGFIAYERGNMIDGVRHLRAALERDPNDPDALFYLGICYVAAGQTDRCEAVAARLMESDPLSPLAWLLAGLAPWWVNRVAAGLPSLMRCVEMDAGNLIARWTLGYGRALVGDVVEAILLERAPDLPYTRQLVGLLEGIGGRTGAALAALGGVAGVDAHHRFHLAEAYAMAGNHDRAFELLEEAVNGGFHPAEFIAVHCPFLAPLRGTPRFEAIAATARRLTAEFPADPLPA
jgi:tetratricopeptide (TPR) repeat protein